MTPLRSHRARRRFRPAVEVLEDRLTPATLTVNTLSDDVAEDAVLTLREAMTLVNAGTVDELSNGLGRALTVAELAQIDGDLGTDDAIHFESSPGVALTGLIVVTTEALPTLAVPVDIQGPGAMDLRIRVFGSLSIFTLDASYRGTISGLSMDNPGLTGGGDLIPNAGQLTLTDCNIGPALGAGIVNQPGGHLILDGVTIRLTNRGIHNFGDLDMVNCTVARNNNSGLFHASSASDSARIRHSTFTDNVSAVVNPGEPGAGGLDLAPSAAPFNLLHTIVAGNFRATLDPNTNVVTNVPADVRGGFAVARYNLIGVDGGIVGIDLMDGVNGNQVGTLASPINARLGSLQENGRGTLSYRLLLDSPALEAGDPNFIPPPSVDQGGRPRVANERIDIGSMEDQTPTGGSIEGQAFLDLDGDGQRDLGEPAQNGRTIRLRYLTAGGMLTTQVTRAIDVNRDGIIDPETERGRYRFTNLLPGDYEVELLPEEGVTQTLPSTGGYLVRLQSSSPPVTGQDFGSVGLLQIVSGERADMTAIACSRFRVPVQYRTTDDDGSLSGLGLRVHFDSSIMTFDGLSGLLTTNFVNQQILDDASNFDDDANTDKYLLVSWADLRGRWPELPLPTKLFDAQFRMTTAAPGDTTSVRFTASSTAVTHGFAGVPVHIEVVEASLDVDSNGVADALSDGQLILRSLFGFVDGTLTSNAVALNATRTDPVEIQQYLEQLRSVILDADDNGVADALTDGALIQRYLFGFRGTALAEGVVDPAGNRTEPDAIVTFLDQFNPQPLPFTPTGSPAPTATPGGTQIITTTTERQDIASGGYFGVDVNYATNPRDDTLRGLGLRLHYNSSALQFRGLAPVTQAGSPLRQGGFDTEDFDNDPSTDLYVLIAYHDPFGQFPGAGSVPTRLLDGQFRALPSFVGQTALRFSASSTALGYTLDAAPLVFEISPPREVSWADPVSGSWENPDNWTGGLVPRSGDSVKILQPLRTFATASLQSSYTVTANSNIYLQSLESGAGLEIVSGTLEVEGQAQLVDLQVRAGALFQVTAGLLTGVGSRYRNAGTLRILDGSFDIVGGELINEPGGLVEVMTVTQSARAASRASSGTRVENQAGARFRMSGTDLATDGSSVENAGDIDIADGNVSAGNKSALRNRAGGQMFVAGSARGGAAAAAVDVKEESTVVNESGGAIGIKVTTSSGGTAQAGFAAAAGSAVKNMGSLSVEGSAEPIRITAASRLDNERGGVLDLGLALLEVEDSTVVNSGLLTTPEFRLIRSQLSGVGRLLGDLFNFGLVRPGLSPGVFTVDGNYTQSADGILELEVAGTIPGSQYDQLKVTGTTTLDGTLQVKVIDGFMPGLTDNFLFLTGGPVVGAFATTTTSTPPGGGQFNLNLDATGKANIVFQPSGPTVESIVFNDGPSQRSIIKKIIITFSELVTVDPGAFDLQRADGKEIGLKVSVRQEAGKTVVELTFRGRRSKGGSLADGQYTLTIFDNRIRNSDNRFLDGDNDGVSGGDALERFFRLFGDADGDGDVDNRDAALFRTALGTTASDAAFIAYFDFNGDGDVDNDDRAQFARRRSRPARSALREW